ncbi:hypothetical protein [Salmonella phage SD-1_S14]|nr:hypothetical protein [Salmonella phage SD-1_S14]
MKKNLIASKCLRIYVTIKRICIYQNLLLCIFKDSILELMYSPIKNFIYTINS